MPLAIRSVLIGFLLTPASVGLAQHHPGGGHAGHPAAAPGPVHTSMPTPGWGGRGSSRGFGLQGPVGYGLVGGGYGLGFSGGGYYGGTVGYQPSGLGFGFSYSGIGAGFPLGLLPFGQEGPGGLMLPHHNLEPTTSTATTVAQRRSNAERAQELTDIGDRSFRGGNYHRAEEKYRLAIKADRDSPTPHVHLAQIAMVRKDYKTAATHLRNAVNATPGSGWLIGAPDIQAMYGEPGDFARQVARLESFLQTHPEDRNAWFVLGAEQYFSGHAQSASDAFTRLNDRVPDQALTAFVDASTVAMRTSAPSNATEP